MTENSPLGLAVRPRWGIAPKRWWLAAGALLLLMLSFIAPGPTFFWNFWGFRSLFHDDLGVGRAWATVIAVPFAFMYVIAFPTTMRWLLFGRRPIYAFLALMVVYGITPLLHAVLDTNFNQHNGASKKWYVVLPSGRMVVTDSGGFDSQTGTQKHLLTPEAARILERQNRGLRPNSISGDPTQIQFFDPVSGRASVWYSRRPDGGYNLYDSEGFDRVTDAILLPVTPDVVADIEKRAADDDFRAKAAADSAAALAKAAADRAEAEAKDKTHRELASIFAPENYAGGAIIVGAQTLQSHDQASLDAAQKILSQLGTSLRARGFIVNNISNQVYGTSYYDAIMNGNAGILADVGLSQKMHSAIFASIEARCRQATSIVGAISCRVTANIRVIRPDTTVGYAGQWSEAGAGSSEEDALTQAVLNLIESHSRTLDGS